MDEIISAPAFDNSYARLPSRFFAPARPKAAANARMIDVNVGLAEKLGISPAWLSSEKGLAVMAGKANAHGSEPIAMAYSGHQFGHFSPQLGDGRAILLGEVVTPQAERFDVQLKGSGPTPFSRGGDGHSALGPVLREYLISEAMAALGVPTTRALAVLETGDGVMREQMLAGGRMVRVAKSHVRVGTFQYFASRQDIEGLRALTDYVLDRLYPELVGARNPALALLDAVGQKQAKLIAHWQSLGFIHGVMNTDNSSISGETIDYGPCAFMDHFNPQQVYSSIDRQGRYAYLNQPKIGQWNLVMLAQALLPLIADEPEAAIKLAQQVVDQFPDLFNAAYQNLMGRKLGLLAPVDADAALSAEFLDLLATNGADMTSSFRQLSAAVEHAPHDFLAKFTQAPAVNTWLDRWRVRLRNEGRSVAQIQAQIMACNPIYIPRNHLVEEVIKSGYAGDFSPFHDLQTVLAQPFEQQAGKEKYALPPAPEQVVQQTFCGT